MADSVRQSWSFVLTAFIALFVAACGGGDGDGNDGGSSGEGANADFPGDIIGERIEFTVTEEVTESSVDVGFTVVYDFSSDGKVQGTNPQTGQILEPVRYEYQVDGNSATIFLYYQYNNGGEGYEEYNLAGKGSILQGSYDYEAVVTAPNQYSAGKAKGDYRIVPPNNVGIYEAPDAADISETKEAIWQLMARKDTIDSVAVDRFRDAYVAVQEDGTLVADTSVGPKTAIGGSVELDSLFKTPPDGKFVHSEVATLLGMAISEAGELWMWAGDGYLSPRMESNLDSPVHAFVERSRGELVVTGNDHSPELVCKERDGICSLDGEQQALDRLNITNIDKAVASFAPDGNVIFLYTGINDGLLRLANSCFSRGCNPPAIIPGLGQVKDFDLRSLRFVVAIESTGQVVAWDWNGNSVPVPSEIGSNAVDLAISVNHVAVVLEDGSAVTWRYDADVDEALDVDIPPDQNDAVSVEGTDSDGHFLFL